MDYGRALVVRECLEDIQVLASDNSESTEVLDTVDMLKEIKDLAATAESVLDEDQGLAHGQGLEGAKG